MKHLAISLVAAFVCSPIFAQTCPVVDVFLDVSDPDNVTLTALNEDGIYGGAYFGIDVLQVFGDLRDIDLTPTPSFDPTVIPDFGLAIVVADGNEFAMFSSDKFWMEYGVSYNLGAIANSSNPEDFWAFSDGSGAGYFRIFNVNESDFDVDFWDGSDGNYLGQIIPEPATLVMLALGGVGVIRRRR